MTGQGNRLSGSCDSDSRNEGVYLRRQASDKHLTVDLKSTTPTLFPPYKVESSCQKRVRYEFSLISGRSKTAPRPDTMLRPLSHPKVTTHEKRMRQEAEQDRRAYGWDATTKVWREFLMCPSMQMRYPLYSSFSWIEAPIGPTGGVRNCSGQSNIRDTNEDIHLYNPSCAKISSRSSTVNSARQYRDPYQTRVTGHKFKRNMLTAEAFGRHFYAHSE